MIVVQRTSSPTITVNKQYLSEFIYDEVLFFNQRFQIS